MAIPESAPDLYTNCHHHWHATGVQTSVHFDDDGRVEEVCCHCGVHRFVRLGFDGKHPCGPYAPEKDTADGR